MSWRGLSAKCASWGGAQQNGVLGGACGPVRALRREFNPRSTTTSTGRYCAQRTCAASSQSVTRRLPVPRDHVSATRGDTREAATTAMPPRTVRAREAVSILLATRAGDSSRARAPKATESRVPSRRSSGSSGTRASHSVSSSGPLTRVGVVDLPRPAGATTAVNPQPPTVGSSPMTAVCSSPGGVVKTLRAPRGAMAGPVSALMPRDRSRGLRHGISLVCARRSSDYRRVLCSFCSLHNTGADSTGSPLARLGGEAR